LASKSAATVVILMGMHKLDQIISIYQENRTDDLPIAIIQNGTKNSEQKVVGNISSITKLVAEKNISSPAIIVIGEVVKNTSKLTSYFQEHFEDEFIFQNLNL
jgi:uroporphyrin-III C-methyltransferase